MSGKITPFTMPKWGIEMEEGVIREWRATEGQLVREGELLAVIETDKIANDVELEFTGTLRRRIGKAEEAYPVGALIAVFAEDDVTEAAIDAFVAGFKPAEAGFADTDVAASAETALSSRSAASTGDASISPKAAELAASLGVDLALVTGSGRNSRISLQDVEQAAKAQGLDQKEAANPHEVIKLNSMRRTIAKRLSEATREVPHFYLRTNVTMDALIELRARRKGGGGPAPSINDYLIKACAVALGEAPDVNVHFKGTEIHRFRHADVSVAVAVDGGLVTPVVRRADEKTVDEIASEMRDLVDRARSEKLEQREYQGGTFSLSNLGMYGVTSFDAVVNPPMGAILAVGSIERIASENGGFKSVIELSLSCDHRAIDGALGGQFLKALKSVLENPSTL